jgi:hypothetical protein
MVVPALLLMVTHFVLVLMKLLVVIVNIANPIHVNLHLA